MTNTLKLIATFFGTGRFPKAPGTMGTLAAVPLSMLLKWAGPLWEMGIIIPLALLGIFAAQAYEEANNTHDSSEIVIDEVVGFLITMVWLPATWQAYVIGFLLFRLLDIWKPFPIGYLDRKIPGGIGVMADDIAAGVAANIVLQIIYTQTIWLGMRIG